MYFDISRHRRARLRSRGQSLTELALILPVLLVIVLVGIDFGRAYFGYVTLTNATRIGANYAAAHPTAWDSPGSPTERAAYQQLILRDTDTANCDLVGGTPPVPTFTDGPDQGTTTKDVGDRVDVGLSCIFQPLTPIVSALVGANLVMSANVDFAIRAGTILGVPVAPAATPGPTPVPTPTPGPGATPTPTPTTCVVPDFVGTGTHKNSAAGMWSGAGFGGGITYSPNPNGNWTITSQSLPAGPAPCTSAITIGG